jgi:signal transduction histidine kinase
VTDAAFDGSAETAAGRTSRRFTVVLNAVGVVVAGFFLVRQGLLAQPAWVVALTAVALLAWLLRSLTLGPTSANSILTGSGTAGRTSRWELAGTIAAMIAAVLGSVVAVPTEVLGYLPALVCIGALTSSPLRPLLLGLGLALLSLLIVSVAVLVNGQVSPSVLLGAGAGLLVSVLVGVSRREYRTSALRQRELLDDRLRLADEREHAAALAERSRIARDIHDVLAHSLGGLVLQLDAVDALLESGKTEEAHSRVLAARGLAASGLDEARRAVDALRDPETSADLGAAIAELVETHRSLGARAELEVVGEPRDLGPDAAGALRSAAQEALSNARRHAPGSVTTLSLMWATDAATLAVTTPLSTGAHASTPAAGPGGGRGLTGLRERVEALDGRADWAVRDGSFVVKAEVPR